jgi:hypothetical protein
MKRYIDYLASKADKTTGIVSYGLSDWTCVDNGAASCVDMVTNAIESRALAQTSAGNATKERGLPRRTSGC